MSHRLLRGYKNCWESISFLIHSLNDKMFHLRIFGKMKSSQYRDFFSKRRRLSFLNDPYGLSHLCTRNHALVIHKEKESVRKSALAPANKNATSSLLSFANSIPARPHPQTNIRKCLSSDRVTFMKQKKLTSGERDVE